MSIVRKCVYDAQGNLVMPTSTEKDDAERSFIYQDVPTPTFNPGHIHFFMISTSGLSPEVARQRENQLLSRFFNHADFVSGFRELDRKTTRGITGNANFAVTHRILYVVDDGRRPRAATTTVPRTQEVPTTRLDGVFGDSFADVVRTMFGGR